MQNIVKISKFKRHIIWWIDVLIISMVFYLLVGERESNVITAVGVIAVVSYFVLMLHYFGFSLGQKIFGLKTVDGKTGNFPTLKKLFLRELFTLTALTGIGFVIADMTYSPKSGFFWDRWTGIKVIPEKLSLAEFDQHAK